MITIFNRKELITTYDMNHYVNAIDALKGTNIGFRTRMKRINSSHIFTRGRGGRTGRKYDTEYTIYVKEADYNRAVNTIHDKEGWK